MDSVGPIEAPLTDEGRYRLLIESVTDYAIYMLDPDGIITSWNRGAQRFMGYEPAEILGEHFSKFYTEEDCQTGLPERALRTAESEGRFEHEGWRLRKDGSRFWAHVIIDPIRHESGRLLGFAKITRDLTERKRAEERLRQSEQQFMLLVQGVTDYAIYMLDPKGYVSSWNAGAQRIKGYTADEIVGQHFSRFYTEEDRASGLPQTALEVAEREGRFEREGWRVRKNGSRFWANVVVDAIRDETGRLIGFGKITRDFTERRETQLALEAAREALFQSQKMDALGQLTGGIAHDFNNLLMAVLASLELVRRRVPNDPKILSLIDNAIQGAQRGTSLTQRMLAFARRQELKLENVDLPILIRGMRGLVKHSLGPAIEIETRFPLSLPSVVADANQIELAILNLAVNARDAMPEGGSIVISAYEASAIPGSKSNAKSGRFVCLSVTDSGEGMDAPTLARATEPFFTSKGPGRGTGLGLSMVHGVMEQLGGRLILKSQPGKGTSAELWFPAKPAEETVARTIGSDKVEEHSAAKTRQLTVLAVDDDPLVLMNMVAMLDDLGHAVIEASSARRVLEILRGGQIVDLVITDQAMPQMTGIQLAREIQAKWPGLPVILATGYAELPTDMGAGIIKLNKPYTLKDLTRAVAKAMESH